jgi:hypothetical protein
MGRGSGGAEVSQVPDEQSMGRVAVVPQSVSATEVQVPEVGAPSHWLQTAALKVPLPQKLAPQLPVGTVGNGVEQVLSQLLENTPFSQILRLQLWSLCVKGLGVQLPLQSLVWPHWYVLDGVQAVVPGVTPVGAQTPATQLPLAHSQALLQVWQFV